ncbi:MAG TPA: sigma-70 family RNA polymerase sigma factor [Amycolatopsis sp.]|uniref:RNA polymerase sigma factor n=1 Tax=Amycolatopsis sp. TaxID=37632 RepID=UPI002B4AA12C|nr:sigma-70 family RNA polymerase sigma factor [Amycolatopsis sp.]HKS44715.1 sigma-70 family RNA polymerase sigma factor [Amycolatopsis sp.]
MDDEELIAALAGGDDGALKELFSRHAPWLAARLRRLLPLDAVEDVLRETFVAVWRGAGRYRPQGKPGAWLWGIAVRQTALWLRRNGRPRQAWPGRVEDPETRAVDRIELAEAVAALEPAERELWRLLFVEDRPEAEVADRLGIPRGTVKSRAFRMRRALRAARGKGEA